MSITKILYLEKSASWKKKYRSQNIYVLFFSVIVCTFDRPLWHFLAAYYTGLIITHSIRVCILQASGLCQSWLVCRRRRSFCRRRTLNSYFQHQTTHERTGYIWFTESSPQWSEIASIFVVVWRFQKGAKWKIFEKVKLRAQICGFLLVHTLGNVRDV